MISELNHLCPVGKDGNPVKSRTPEYRKWWARNNKTKVAAYKSKWYQKNREQILHAGRAKRAANPEQQREMRRNYIAKNPEHHKAVIRACRQKRLEHYNQKQREYLTANRAGRNAYLRRRYAAKRAELIAYKSEWRAKNKDKTRGYEKKWRANNREAFRQKNHRRRERLLTGVAPTSGAVIVKWEKAWRNKPTVSCYWCGGAFSPKQCHSDHIVPAARGGRHVIENLAIACSECNHKKHAHMPAVFSARLRQPHLAI